MTAESKPYPVNIKGELIGVPSRGLWLIKWLLGIPHWIILFFLGIASFFVWIISWFAILFTGKFPKGLFDFQVGVTRWSWRVGFYSYSALGTDKYPPFSLQPIADYPADFDVAYPERLSRGLIFVKWWLLSIPHLIITGIFADIIAILAIVVGIILLFAHKYPADIFRFMIGMNRWTYRVNAYVYLLRDEYPPFRLWD